MTASKARQQKPRAASSRKFDVHHPHDSLFKFVFQVRAHMRALLRVYLPRPLTELIQWEEMRIEPGSFVDGRLKASYSDILVSAPVLGYPFRLYFLFEHKSQEEPDTLLQVFELLSQAASRLSREGSGPSALAPVLAVVLHHGPRPWKGALRMDENYRLPPQVLEVCGRYLMNFEAILVDLKTIPMDQIRNVPVVEATLKALKAVSEGREEEFLEELKRTMRRKGMKGFIATLLLYTLCTGKPAVEKQVLEIAKLSRESKIMKEVMTGAEYLMERGRKEGLEKGLEKGREEGLEKGLLIGQITLIQELLGRKPSRTSALESQSVDALEKLLQGLKSARNPR